MPCRFAMYLVVGFCIHNFKVRKAWEERDAEAVALSAEYNALKESLLDSAWLAQLEAEVRKSKVDQGVLASAMKEKLDGFSPIKKPAEAKEKVQAKVEPEVMHIVGSAPAGIKVNDKVGGKVI